MRLSPHEIAWLAINVNVSGARLMTNDEVITTVAIWLAESMGDTDIIAYSPTTSAYYGNADHGGGQISGWWHGPKLQLHRFRDPFDNMRMFKMIWKDAGYNFGPWNVTDTGAEQKYLKMGEVGLKHPFEPINPHTTAWRRL